MSNIANPRDSWPAWTDQPAGWPVETAPAPPQPDPIRTIVRRFHRGPHGEGEAVSAITRIWRRDDIGTCRLCPVGKCALQPHRDPEERGPAVHTCLVAVAGEVADEDAPLYSRN